MKRVLFIPFLLFAVLSMAVCEGGNEELVQDLTEATGHPEGNESDSASHDDSTVTGGNGRYLVLYASRTNNTERVARLIQEMLDCDILEVEPAVPYEDDYQAMLARAQDELAAIRQGRYPAVKTVIGTFEKYDVVFVGYPIWYGSMATPMQTFLHTHAAKLLGKRIVLFATSGSSGMSASVNEARDICAGATIAGQPLLLTSSDMSQMEDSVRTWVKDLVAVPEVPDSASVKVSMTVGDRTITATMEDNAVARDFLSRLPLEITLSDYNNMTEKIFYPSPELTINGVSRGCAPTAGDVTVYVPWGNVAIFCKNWSYSNDLIKIGHIDGDGVEALKVSGNIRVRMEKL